MVDVTVIQDLGVPPSGVTNIVGVTGAGNQPTYPASLSFPGTPIPPIAFTDFVAILGRNILKQFVLVYNGPGGFVSLSF